ncbi:hypothetical protein HanIR_Chr04g0186801 [Helianthus annuus]|nr:hypothetical protein HanIR_Chr04g0186801 [Helianthus annuus]
MLLFGSFRTSLLCCLLMMTRSGLVLKTFQMGSCSWFEVVMTFNKPVQICVMILKLIEWCRPDLYLGRTIWVATHRFCIILCNFKVC